MEAEAPSAERLKRQRRTSETRTCITVEPLPPTSVHLLKDRLETQTGRNVSLNILKFNGTNTS